MDFWVVGRALNMESTPRYKCINPYLILLITKRLILFCFEIGIFLIHRLIKEPDHLTSYTISRGQELRPVHPAYPSCTINELRDLPVSVKSE